MRRIAAGYEPAIFGRKPRELRIDFASCRDYVLHRIQGASIDAEPFRHAFIDNIFPRNFFESLRRHMRRFKHSPEVTFRAQDNPAFQNRRYNLENNNDDITATIRAIFEDHDVRMALLAKFYLAPTPEFCSALRIHEEFEYVFTAAGRFQNIHVDIPPKFMSFVFYIPERDVTSDEAEKNATILYDRNLKPQYNSRFQANSVCLFAPHFASYHGFSSTIERDVLVMFYVEPIELEKWRRLRTDNQDTPPFDGIRDAIESKLARHPLIEFGHDPETLAMERQACLVNAPQGRVFLTT